MKLGFAWVGLVATTHLVVACGSEDEGKIDQTSVSSGAGAQGGGGKGTGNEGGLGGSAGGPSGTDATVIVSNQGAVLEGLDVIFHGPDGSVTATVKTDAQGKASSPVEAGAAVTVVSLFYPGQTTQLKTLMGVDPGDVIAFTGAPSWNPARAAPTSVMLPGAVEGATWYQVFGPCEPSGTQDPSEPLLVWLDCLPAGQTSFGLTSVAMDATGTPLRYGVASTSVGTSDVAIPAWSIEWNTMLATLADLPDVGGEYELVYSATSGPPYMAALWGEMVGGTPTISAELKIPKALTGTLRLDAALYGAVDDLWPSSRLTRSDIPASAPSSTIAYGDFLPLISELTIESAGDASRPTVKHKTQSSRVADAVMVSMYWGETLALSRGTWSLVAPGDAPTITLPELPESLASARVEASDEIGCDLTMFESDELDYADMKSKPDQMPSNFWSNPYVQAAPLPGTLRTSSAGIHPSR